MMQQAKWIDFHDRHFAQAAPKSSGFFGGKAKPETIELRRVMAKYESRSNMCKFCFVAMPCACDC